MPIEFRCTACDKLLRTPDETAGKQAKCPECGALMQIPSPAAAASAGSVPQPPPAASEVDAANPYRSPADYTPPVPASPGTFRPSRIDFGDVFGRTFRIFGQEWSSCILVFLAFTGVILLFLAVAGGAALGLAVAADDEAVTIVAIIFALGATWLFGTWLGIGMRIFFLKLARGDDPRMADLFGGGPYFVTTLLAGLLFGLAYLGGLILFIIPGIIFGLMFSQFQYMIIDRNAGVVESLSLSKQFTYGNKLMLFAILLVANLVCGFINQACGLAAFVTVPFLSLLSAVIYLVMTGQATADERYPSSPRYLAPPAAGSPFAPASAEQSAAPKIETQNPNNP